MVSIVFIILFIFSMCITVIVASINIVDASNREIQQSTSALNSGKPCIIHISTYNEIKTEPTETEFSEATEPTTKKSVRIKSEKRLTT